MIELPRKRSRKEVRKAEGVKLDNEISPAGLRKIIDQSKAAIKKHTGKEFPEDPHEQVW